MQNTPANETVTSTATAVHRKMCVYGLHVPHQWQLMARQCRGHLPTKS